MLKWGNKEEIRNAIMNLGSENADKVGDLLARITYLENSDDFPFAELSAARYNFLRTLELMVKEDRRNYEMDLKNEKTRQLKKELGTYGPEIMGEVKFRKLFK